jgi:AAA+ ATPase superfamily predicted ATPase
MRFLNRRDELSRLDALMRAPQGGLAVIHGRRRLGKTRLLVEWARKHAGLYTVADLSAAEIQRRYFAEAVAALLPGFAEVTYPDWLRLFLRFAAEARRKGWRGPVVLDEFPYLALASPELPSVLQRFVDHEAREARLVLAVAGSSQRMMQGIVLSSEAPLFGRARETLEIRPLAPRHLKDALALRSDPEVVEAYAAWGGVPRYWELAAEVRGDQRSRVEKLVLDPLGPLHGEPDRLLIEEVPSAVEARPILDAVGAGVHRVSEIAGRMGRPATSISRPLERLLEMGLLRREVPFGEPERGTKRSLYRIDDPFFRLWFRVVAPNRGALTSGTRQTRLELLNRHWPSLVASTWEDLCRKSVPSLRKGSTLSKLGPWQPASRWWRGQAPEWDIVAVSRNGKRLLLGEAKWSGRPLGASEATRLLGALAGKAPPDIAGAASKQVVRALFVPAVASRAVLRGESSVVVTATDVLA